MVFVDTGFYIAATFPRDQWHSIAIAASGEKQRYVTSNLVLNETVALMAGRGFLSAALDFISSIRAARDTEIVYVDADLQVTAWSLLGRHAGWGASPVDCASFAIMRRLGIERAYTFDGHFKTAGFKILGE
jgi:hypothetical protein